MELLIPLFVVPLEQTNTWERMVEVNLLSILVHTNPCQFYSYQPFLYRIHSGFAKVTMLFPIEPRVQCRLRLIHIQTECGRDALGVPNRLRNENLLASSPPRHNPKRAHRKRDFIKIIVGSFFYYKKLSGRHVCGSKSIDCKSLTTSRCLR